MIAVLLITACAQASTPTPPSNTGITGLVTLGPMCPVEQAGQPCPDQPYQARIDVLDAQGTTVTSIQSDANGRFTVDLPPGDYVLHPLPPEGNILPMAGDLPVTVTTGQYTDVQISYDSGIR